MKQDPCFSELAKDQDSAVSKKSFIQNGALTLG